MFTKIALFFQAKADPEFRPFRVRRLDALTCPFALEVRTMPTRTIMRVNVRLRRPRCLPFRTRQKSLGTVKQMGRSFPNLKVFGKTTTLVTLLPAL